MVEVALKNKAFNFAVESRHSRGKIFMHISLLCKDADTVPSGKHIYKSQGLFCEFKESTYSTQFALL